VIARSVAAFVLALVLVGPAAGRPHPPPPVDATGRWAVASPASENMDPALLAKADGYVRAHLPLVTSLLVVRHGAIVSEHYYGSTQSTLGDVQSVTKSVVSALVGIALRRGQIHGIDQELTTLLPPSDFSAADDSRVRSITLRDLLTMQGGWTSDLRSGNFRYTTAPNWPRALIERPLASTPGTRFDYDSGTAHLVSAALSGATGSSAFDEAQRYLFGPIGIRDATWTADPQGISIGGWGLDLTARDMARLGYLYLHGGRWHGRQVVPAAWVSASTGLRVHTGAKADGWGYPPWRGYGYFWWRYPLPGAFMAVGYGGQFIIAWPKLDLVVVTTALVQPDSWDLHSLVERYIVPAVRQS
jgi:CubicO group peptidase (beta-lactamase class C family)